jgi:hypothetical protein
MAVIRQFLKLILIQSGLMGLVVFAGPQALQKQPTALESSIKMRVSPVQS